MRSSRPAHADLQGRKNHALQLVMPHACVWPPVLACDHFAPNMVLKRAYLRCKFFWSGWKYLDVVR